MNLAAPAMAFILGLCIGSFLNVCIHRLPLGQSIVRPRSRCPRCRKPIAAYDNIPLLSYLLLGGRCRHCRASISPLYPAVELLTGVTFVLVYLHYGLSANGLKAALLGSALIALSFIDLRHRLLPDAITYPGIAAGFLFSLWVSVDDGTTVLLWRSLGGMPIHPKVFSVADALLGALLGGGLLFGLGEVWFRLRKVEGLGLGDVKLMVMVGLFLGLKLTVLTLLLGSLVGSLIGGGFMLATRKDSHYELPLGTFLGWAAWVVLFWGRPLVGAYLGLFR